MLLQEIFNLLAELFIRYVSQNACVRKVNSISHRYEFSAAGVQAVNLLLDKLAVSALSVFVAFCEYHFEEGLNLDKSVVFVETRFELLS